MASLTPAQFGQKNPGGFISNSGHCSELTIFSTLLKLDDNFSMTKQSTYWKFVTAFVAIMVVAAGSYFIWNKYFKYDQEKVYKEAEQKYIAAMTADTYGGKTPKETLDLFVDALRKGDVELASKYFLLDENLSRDKWLTLITDIKNRGYIAKLADDISRKAEAGNLISENQFGYVLRNGDGTIGLQIDLRFNRYSKVWKIESL